MHIKLEIREAWMDGNTESEKSERTTDPYGEDESSRRCRRDVGDMDGRDNEVKSASNAGDDPAALPECGAGAVAKEAAARRGSHWV